MSKEKRFIKTYAQSEWAGDTEIWVDTETGVNYIYHTSGHSGGFTPLLDREGKPVITAVLNEN